MRNVSNTLFLYLKVDGLVDQILFLLNISSGLTIIICHSKTYFERSLWMFCYKWWNNCNMIWLIHDDDVDRNIKFVHLKCFVFFAFFKFFLNIMIRSFIKLLKEASGYKLYRCFCPSMINGHLVESNKKCSRRKGCSVY